MTGRATGYGHELLFGVVLTPDATDPERVVGLAVHAEQGSYLGGVHLELTGDAVTECLGGSEGLDEQGLAVNYTTFCDPRLNEKQALELAFLVADHYRSQRNGNAQ